MSASCLYVGAVRHRRFGSVEHELRARLFMAYLDLDELPGVLDGSWLWSGRRPAIAWFRREDHLGDPALPLSEQVRDLVAARTGQRPGGAVRLLTNLRYWGHCFNPVSFYYCARSREDPTIQAIVAEVTNTPWGERHAYVLTPEPDGEAGDTMHGRFAKEFHVSPFMGMDHTYRWQMTVPAESLLVQIDSEREGRLAFDATLQMRRRALSPAVMRRLLVRHPMLTLDIVRRIYTHGVRLHRKGARYFPNPTGTPIAGPARRRAARSTKERAAR